MRSTVRDGLFGLALALCLAPSLAAPAMADDLVAAVLPSGRATVSGGTVTAFATVINASGHPVSGCTVATLQPSTTLTFYQTNPATNQPVGAANAPASIATGGAQTFVFAVTATDILSETNIPLQFSCTGAVPASTLTGLDTLLLTSDTTTPPDVVALAVTPTGDGVIRFNTVPSSQAFAVATFNLGSANTITASADTGDLNLPLALTICQTDAQSNCMAPPAATVATTMGTGATPTYGIFLTATGPMPFQPRTVRVYVRFRDSSGIMRGGTSVAAVAPGTLTAGSTAGGIFRGMQHGLNGTEFGLGGSAAVIVSEDGEIRSLMGAGTHFVGHLSLASDLSFSATGTAYSAMTTTFSDGQTAEPMAIGGIVSPHAWLTGNYTTTATDSGIVNVNYSQSEYERGSSLGTISGNWNLRDPLSGANIGTLAFGADGSFSGTDKAGCQYSGKFQTIDTRYNTYRLSLTVANCASANGSFSGLGATTDTVTTNDTLLLGTSSAAVYRTDMLTRY